MIISNFTARVLGCNNFANLKLWAHKTTYKQLQAWFTIERSLIIFTISD